MHAIALVDLCWQQAAGNALDPGTSCTSCTSVNAVGGGVHALQSLRRGNEISFTPINFIFLIVKVKFKITCVTATIYLVTNCSIYRLKRGRLRKSILKNGRLWLLQQPHPPNNCGLLCVQPSLRYVYPQKTGFMIK